MLVWHTYTSLAAAGSGELVTHAPSIDMANNEMTILITAVCACQCSLSVREMRSATPSLPDRCL
jgi:hypothetical protein